MPAWVMSEAVTVWRPEVLFVKFKVTVPALRAALAGTVAWASEETG